MIREIIIFCSLILLQQSIDWSVLLTFSLFYMLYLKNKLRHRGILYILLCLSCHLSVRCFPIMILINIIYTLLIESRSF